MQLPRLSLQLLVFSNTYEKVVNKKGVPAIKDDVLTNTSYEDDFCMWIIKSTELMPVNSLGSPRDEEQSPMNK